MPTRPIEPKVGARPTPKTVVPADQFKAVVRALLSAPPLPLADIGKKRKAKPARRKR
jgi:hypothetical protein